MKKRPSIVLLSSFLVGGGFCSIEAQNYDPQFYFHGAQKNTPDILKMLDRIYRVDDMIENLPFVILEDVPILVGNSISGHGSADEESMYDIDAEKIGNFLDQSQTFEEFYQKMRSDSINFLFRNGYSNFNAQPYKEGSLAIAVASGDFKVTQEITKDDGLDALLKDKLQVYKDDFENVSRFANYLNFKNIGITTGEYEKLGTLFLFKNEQDLRDLGYALISRKTRINTDPDYRRHNIKTAFANIGNVRLIMPGETFTLGDAFRYHPSAAGSEDFVEGYITVGNGAKMFYGGGLCGVATAFYQGTLTNLGLSLLKYRAHSTYYRNLYEAEINGVMITDPGLDATVYTPLFDVKVKNIRDYPIVVGFNFDGLSGSMEQVFTLSKAQDRGSFAFVGSYKKAGSQCFTRKINGKNRTNCYKHIKNF